MDSEPLTKLDPAYTTVMRIEGALTVLPFLVIALVLGVAGVLPQPYTWAPMIVPVLIAIVFVLLVPVKRFMARGYQFSDDRLRVVKGVLFHADTVVPFSRVQHLDVEQGPLERAFGIARLILHTAGTHNSSVTLPGLAHADAVSMREEIRAHVKRESL